MIKKTLMLVALAMASAVAQARSVALIVQNHCAPIRGVPMAAFADHLTARLSGNGLTVINPSNVFGTDQNRTAAGDELPTVSAMELAKLAKADGAVTASVLEFFDLTSAGGRLHEFKVSVSLSFVDGETGGAICGETVTKKTKKYTTAQVTANGIAYYEMLLREAADECAEKLLKNSEVSKWQSEVKREPPKPEVKKPEPKPTYVPPPPQPKKEEIVVMRDNVPVVKPVKVSDDLTMEDIDAAIQELMVKMFADSHFGENYENAKNEVERTPIVVIGGIENKGADKGKVEDVEGLLDASSAAVRVALFNSGMFEVKDDDASVALAKRIVGSGNSPLEDGEIMSALKAHGSPDFFVLGDLRHFRDSKERHTYRLRLAFHNLATGKIVWEGIHNIVK